MFTKIEYHIKYAPKNKIIIRSKGRLTYFASLATITSEAIARKSESLADTLTILARIQSTWIRIEWSRSGQNLVTSVSGQIWWTLAIEVGTLIETLA